MEIINVCCQLYIIALIYFIFSESSETINASITVKCADVGCSVPLAKGKLNSYYQSPVNNDVVFERSSVVDVYGIYGQKYLVQQGDKVDLISNTHIKMDKSKKELMHKNGIDTRLPKKWLHILFNIRNSELPTKSDSSKEKHISSSGSDYFSGQPMSDGTNQDQQFSYINNDTEINNTSRLDLPFMNDINVKDSSKAMIDHESIKNADYDTSDESLSQQIIDTDQDQLFNSYDNNETLVNNASPELDLSVINNTDGNRNKYIEDNESDRSDKYVTNDESPSQQKIESNDQDQQFTSDNINETAVNDISSINNTNVNDDKYISNDKVSKSGEYATSEELPTSEKIEVASRRFSSDNIIKTMRNNMESESSLPSVNNTNAINIPSKNAENVVKEEFPSQQNIDSNHKNILISDDFNEAELNAVNSELNLPPINNLVINEDKDVIDNNNEDDDLEESGSSAVNDFNVNHDSKQSNLLSESVLDVIDSNPTNNNIKDQKLQYSEESDSSTINDSNVSYDSKQSNLLKESVLDIIDSNPTSNNIKDKKLYSAFTYNSGNITNRYSKDNSVHQDLELSDSANVDNLGVTSNTNDNNTGHNSEHSDSLDINNNVIDSDKEDNIVKHSDLVFTNNLNADDGKDINCIDCKLGINEDNIDRKSVDNAQPNHNIQQQSSTHIRSNDYDTNHKNRKFSEDFKQPYYIPVYDYDATDKNNRIISGDFKNPESILKIGTSKHDQESSIEDNHNQEINDNDSQENIIDDTRDMDVHFNADIDTGSKTVHLTDYLTRNDKSDLVISEDAARLSDAENNVIKNELDLEYDSSSSDSNHTHDGNASKDSNIFDTLWENLLNWIDYIFIVIQKFYESVLKLGSFFDQPAIQTPQNEAILSSKYQESGSDSVLHDTSDNGYCIKNMEVECGKDASKSNFFYSSFYNILDTNTNSVPWNHMFAILDALIVFGLCVIYRYFRGKSHHNALIYRINQLERKLLIASKKNLLSEGIGQSEQQCPGRSFTNEELQDDNTVAIAVLQDENEQLQHKITYLQNELSKVSSSALEIHKLLENTLSSGTVQAEVDSLHKTVQEQETVINDLKKDFKSITKENESLVSNLGKMRVEYNIQVKRNLELSDKLYSLKMELEKESETSSEIEIMQRNEIHDLRAKLDEMHLLLRRNETENQTLKRTILNDNNMNPDNLQTNVDLATLEKFNTELSREIKEINHSKALLEDEIKVLKITQERFIKERSEAETKLHVLSDYFNEKEAQLRREIESREFLFNEKESNKKMFDHKVSLLTEELEKLKTENEELRKEILDQERSYKTQLSNEEQKSRERWFALRQAERKYKESEQEAANLRNRILMFETNMSNNQYEIKASGLVNGIDVNSSPGSVPSMYHNTMPSEIMFASSDFMSLPPPPLSDNNLDFFPPEPLYSPERLSPLGGRRVPSPPPPLPLDDIPPPPPRITSQRNRNVLDSPSPLSANRSSSPQRYRNHYRQRNHIIDRDSPSSGLSVESLEKSGRS